MISQKIVWHTSACKWHCKMLSITFKTFSAFYSPDPRGFLTQYHKTICFSGSSSMPRVHFDWPQKLSHRPTLFFLLIKEGNTTYFALNASDITSLETKVLLLLQQFTNAFFQKKLCASIFVADFLWKRRPFTSRPLTAFPWARQGYRWSAKLNHVSDNHIMF